MQRILTIGWILLFLLTSSSVVWGKSVGYLVLKKGRVVIHGIKKEEVHEQVGKQIPLFEKDEIHSDEDTGGEVYLRNRQEVIQLYSSSYLRIESFKRSESKIGLPFGKARFVVNKKTRRRRRFQVRTANAIVGVKGTDFVVQTNGDSTDVLTLDGLVSLANAASPTRTINIARNQASRTRRQAPPVPPVRVSEEIQQEIITSESDEGWDVDLEVPEPEQGDQGQSRSETENEDLQEEVEEIQTQVEQTQETVDQVEELQRQTEKTIQFNIINE